MRDIPEDLAAHIESGAATMAHVWIVTRKDAVRLGFTDHDRNLAVDGVTALASSGWTAGAAETEIGFAPGLASAAGALDSDAITEADLAAGLYDEATVELYRVDWSEPELRVRLWKGAIRRLTRRGGALTAEIEGPLAALLRVAGRTFGKTCDANLGDARCTVDLASFPGEVCDKRFATCGSVFGNSLNFQGFPAIPGDDFLTAYPTAGARNDGSAR